MQKNWENSSTSSCNIKNLLFWHTLGMPGCVWPRPLKITINLKPLRNLIYTQQIEIIAKIAYKILKKWQFDTFWACLGMFGQGPTQNQNFPKFGIFTRKLVAMWFFNLHRFQKKNNDNFLGKITKTLFWAHFCPFLGIFPKNRIFPKKWAMSFFSVHGPITSCKVSKNSNERILRKRRYGRTDERTDGQTDGQTTPKS